MYKTPTERTVLTNPLSESSAIKDVNKVICLCMFIILVLFCLLNIPIIIVAVKAPGECDNTDPMGLNVAQYLLGAGISSLIVNLSAAIIFIILFNNENMFFLVVVPFIIFVYTLFYIAWFIVGAVILFRSNIECINIGSGHVVFALVYWCLSAAILLCGLCGTSFTIK